jgi:hypothetical protein
MIDQDESESWLLRDWIRPYTELRLELPAAGVTGSDGAKVKSEEVIAGNVKKLTTNS